MFVTFFTYQVGRYQRNELLTHTMRYLHELSTVVWCLFPLFNTLRNLQFSQGSLNWDTTQHHKRQSSLIEDPMRNIASLRNGDGIKLNLNLLDMPLYLFVDDEDNHRVFSAYLRHCFAIENLLFIERVSIFKELILAATQTADSVMPTINEQEEESLSVMELTIASIQPKIAIPRMKLLFLTSLYAEMQALVGFDGCGESDGAGGDFEHHRVGLHAAATMICDSFVQQQSKTEVNLPFGTRSTIMRRISNVDNFKDYDDYAKLFDEAFVEIFRLIMSIYTYRFKPWCCL